MLADGLSEEQEAMAGVGAGLLWIFADDTFKATL